MQFFDCTSTLLLCIVVLGRGCCQCLSVLRQVYWPQISSGTLSGFQVSSWTRFTCLNRVATTGVLMPQTVQNTVMEVPRCIAEQIVVYQHCTDHGFFVEVIQLVRVTHVSQIVGIEVPQIMAKMWR